MSGSFLPSSWFSTNHSLLGSQEPALLCNHVPIREFLMSGNATYQELRGDSPNFCRGPAGIANEHHELAGSWIKLFQLHQLRQAQFHVPALPREKEENRACAQSIRSKFPLRFLRLGGARSPACEPSHSLQNSDTSQSLLDSASHRLSRPAFVIRRSTTLRHRLRNRTD